jgi:hypothetical protein
MATVIEIARRAGVGSEDVLRVLMGEPIRFETEQSVRDAIDELGPPPYPRRPGTELAEIEPSAPSPAPLPEIVDALPNAVGTVVYEALRIEVRPVAEGMAQMGSLVEELFRRLDNLAAQVAAERSERVDDLALVTDLITTGWRTVDRRVGRVEAMAERSDLARSLHAGNGRNGGNGSGNGGNGNGHVNGRTAVRAQIRRVG